jgi:hypothetical protein
LTPGRNVWSIVSKDRRDIYGAGVLSRSAVKLIGFRIPRARQIGLSRVELLYLAR